MTASTWRVYRVSGSGYWGRFSVFAELEHSDQMPILVAENLTAEEASEVIQAWTPPGESEQERRERLIRRAERAWDEREPDQ